MNLDAALPDRLRGPATTITKIAAGLSGAGVYRVDAAGELFVLKISNPAESIAAWRRRLRIQQRAAEAALAPRVVDSDESRRAVVSAFVADRSFPLYYRDPATHDAAFIQLARVIRRVHDLPLPADVEPNDTRTLLATLWSGLGKFAVPAFIADVITRLLAVSPARERALVLSHNDVNPSNLVYDGEKIMLVDWDAAGVNDPFFDLAAASLFLRMDAESCAKLLAVYDDAPVAELPAGFIYNRRLLGALFCVMSMSHAHQRGHPGFTEPASLEAAPLLADFYQRLRSGAVSLTSAEGGWEFALALFRESTVI